jgi:hypothetical protein
VRALGIFGFEESWDLAVVEEARSYACEFCGNEMDVRIYVEPELGNHPYAYCTFKGCRWWLEFRRGSVLSVRCRSLSGAAIDGVVVRFSGMSRRSGAFRERCHIFADKDTDCG